MTTTPSAPQLTVAELDVLEERHVEYEDSGLCFKCVEPWPCDASRLLSMARDALALHTASAALLNVLEDEHWELYEEPGRCGGCHDFWPCVVGLHMQAVIDATQPDAPRRARRRRKHEQEHCERDD